MGRQLLGKDQSRCLGIIENQIIPMAVHCTFINQIIDQSQWLSIALSLQSAMKTGGAIVDHFNGNPKAI